MSHRHDCPDEWSARSEGSRHAGYGDWTSRYSNPYSGYDGCPEAARAWERGFEQRKEEMAEEYRQEQAQQRAAEQRRNEEAEYERACWEQQEQEQHEPPPEEPPCPTQ